MKNYQIFNSPGPVEPCDKLLLFIFPRVTARYEYNVAGIAFLPGKCEVFEVPIGSAEKCFSEVCFQQRQNSFRFRIAESAVELHNRWILLFYHKPRVDNTPVVDILLRKCLNERNQNGVDCSVHNPWTDHRGGGNGSHTSRVWPPVSVMYWFVVLRRDKRDNILPVAECKHRGLFSFEKILHNNF